MAAHLHNVIACSGGGDENERANPMEEMSKMFGPGHVDSVIRQAIQSCWISLPGDRRNVDEVEKEIRRLVERALLNLREDAMAFGLTA